MFKKQEDRNQYIFNNFHTIISIVDLNEYQCRITKAKFDDSYNNAIVGVMTLSMSKRIMNEVMDIANTLKSPIYYQDTDSMHMLHKDVQSMAEEYKRVYNKDLIGSQLGQFHSDFDLKGAVGEVYSTKSVFLGKKCYMDYLEGFDKEGKKINGYHLRMKGITQAGLEDAKNKYGSFDEVYEKLAKDETIDFWLNANDKVMFEYLKSGGIRTRAKFIRSVNFKDMINDDDYEN